MDQEIEKSIVALSTEAAIHQKQIKLMIEYFSLITDLVVPKEIYPLYERKLDRIKELSKESKMGE